MPGFVCDRCGHLNEVDEDDAVAIAADQLALVDVPQEESLFDGEPGSENAETGRPESRGTGSEGVRTHSTPLFEDAKPPYRVPTMEEIAETPPNGLSVVSTFSGMGGSCLGFKMAGFETLIASEFIPAAIETYEANFPGVPVLTSDIREVDPANVLLSLGLELGELDVLEGSPPCSSFSSAGRREAGWGEVKKYSDTKQRTDDLFDEYIRMVEGLRPKVFVAENVVGFLHGAAEAFKAWVDEMLTNLGYLVRFKVLDAALLGVPQRRRRVIIIGVRRDVGLDPFDFYPEPLPYTYSLRDAIGVPEGTMVGTRIGGENALVSSDDPAPTITANGIGGRSNRGRNDEQMLHLPIATEEELAETSIERFAIGEAWDEIGGIGQSERYFSLVRPDPDEPVPTVTQTGGNLGAASVVHPTEKRKFTIPELKRICGFPDDFVVTGSYGQQWERLGRAVPPLMMYAVASKIRDALLTSSASRGAADPSPDQGASEASQPKPGSDDVDARGAEEDFPLGEFVEWPSSEAVEESTSLAGVPEGEDEVEPGIVLPIDSPEVEPTPPLDEPVATALWDDEPV